MLIKEEEDKLTKKAVLAKWLYELYQAQGKKGTNYSDEVILARVTGFQHCENLVPIPRFYIGCDHEKYKEDALVALSRLYDILEARQNKLVIEKNRNPNYQTNPLKFKGLKDFTASFTNEELENLGADTPEKKRVLIKKLVNEYFTHLTNNAGMDLVMATHVYKKGTSDCHIKAIRFDKRGMVFNEHNLHDRMMETLLYMHRRKEYKGKLIAPKNLREKIPHKIAKDELTEAQKLEISRRIVSANAKWINDFKDPDVKVYLQMKSGKRTAVDYSNRKYNQDKDEVKGIFVEYAGYKFFSNILTPEADRRLQLILEAERLMDKKGFDLYEVKDKLNENLNLCATFEDYTDKCLEDGIRVLPVTSKDKYTNQTRITGWRVHPIGLNNSLKISCFDIDLFKSYDLNKFDLKDMNRVMNEGIKHSEAYAQFTAGEMKLKHGETIDSKLAEIREKQAHKYLSWFKVDGDNYVYKSSSTPSFRFNASTGTATINKMNRSSMNAVGSLFASTGTVELMLTGVDRREAEEIYILFGSVKGIKVLSAHVDSAMESKLYTAIHEKAAHQFRLDLSRLESKLIHNNGRPVTSINVMPILAENKTILSYENIWMILDKVATLDIDLKKISSSVFVENEVYLKERFKNNSKVLKYVQARIDRHSQDLEVKAKAYEDLKTKAVKR